LFSTKLDFLAAQIAVERALSVEKKTEKADYVPLNWVADPVLFSSALSVCIGGWAGF
jgi:hypothetical protein